MLHSLALLLTSTHRAREAEPLFRRALEIKVLHLGENHPYVANTQHELGVLLNATNRVREAEPLFRRALEIRMLNFSDDSLEVGASSNALAQLLRDTNRVGEAEPLFRRTLDIVVRRFGENGPEVAAIRNLLSKCLEDLGRFDKAAAMYQHGLEHAPNDIVLLGNYAFLLQNVRHDLPSACAMYERALAADPADYINHTNLAGVHIVQEKYAEAEEHLCEAWRLIGGQATRYAARTLFLRAAIAALGGRDVTTYLGQMKTLFDQGIETYPSRNTSVREHLRQHLGAESFALFDAIYTAINEADGLARLKDRPDWQSIPPIAWTSSRPSN